MSSQESARHRPTRLCFVMHQSTMEGAGRYMLDQVVQLQERGVVVFAVLPSEGPLKIALAEQNVRVRVVPNPWWTKDSGDNGDPPYGQTLLTAQAIATALREWQVDVVYTHTGVILAGALAAAITGLPHVWHIHEFAYNATGLMMRIPKPELIRLFVQTSNRVYFSSKAVSADWTEALTGVETRIVYNWTSSTLSTEPPDLTDGTAVKLLQNPSVFVVAVVGSVIPWKRQADVIEAVGNLQKEGFDVALLVVGPLLHAAYAVTVKGAAARQPNPERIRFCGYTEFPDRVMRAATVSVVCSDREPFGRVTIESMAQGTPVVGADSGGTPEIIRDSVNGLLYPTGDVEALTSCLRRLLVDPALRTALSSGARQDRRFTDASAAITPVFADLALLHGASNPGSPVASLLGRGVEDAIGEMRRRNSPAGLARRLLAPFRG